MPQFKPKPAKKPAPGAKPRAAKANGHASKANGHTRPEATRKANGHFTPGHGAPGPGRPRSGAPNGAANGQGYLSADVIRRSLLAEQRRRPTLFDQLTVDQRRELADTAGLTPLQFLMSVMLDPSRYMDVRIDAAKACAPYFHRKMPQAIELPEHLAPALDIARLLALPRDDREVLLSLLKRIGVDLAAPALPMAERVAPGADQGEADG